MAFSFLTVKWRKNSYVSKTISSRYEPRRKQDFFLNGPAEEIFAFSEPSFRFPKRQDYLQLLHVKFAVKVLRNIKCDWKTEKKFA